MTSPKAGEVVVVSATSQRENSEPLVILRPGDHPFVQHESVVAYRFSEIREVATIEAALRSGQARLREPIGEDLLRRIRAGLKDSDFTPNHVRQYFLEVAASHQSGFTIAVACSSASCERFF
ncbi:MAG TPA: hypothetical protein VNF74_02365 [Terriglobales bacterium]|nr:hypothetical protein [Terriglobales bacterium]